MSRRLLTRLMAVRAMAQLAKDDRVADLLVMSFASRSIGSARPRVWNVSRVRHCRPVSTFSQSGIPGVEIAVLPSACPVKILRIA